MHRILTVIIPQLWYRPAVTRFSTASDSYVRHNTTTVVRRAQTHTPHTPHTPHTHHKERGAQVPSFEIQRERRGKRGGEMGVKSKLEARQVPVPTLRSHRLVQTKAPSSAKRLRWKEKVLRPGGEALIEAERRVPCRWQTGRSAPLPLCPYRRPRGKALAQVKRGEESGKSQI